MALGHAARRIGHGLVLGVNCIFPTAKALYRLGRRLAGIFRITERKERPAREGER
jgi:hypothetical protein